MNPKEEVEGYFYHFECKEGLPKHILRAMQKWEDEVEEREARWDREFGGKDHIW